MNSRNDQLPCPVCSALVGVDTTRCPSCNTDFSAAGIGASATLVRLRQSEPIDMHVLLDDLVDTLSPRFQGLRRLGHGGMGVVYVARDPLLKRDVAVKLLAPEFRADDNARERFVREAQAAAAVAHPNVVNIYQVGELKATRLPYFVMQFVEGNTVEQAYPRGAPVAEQVARRITAEVAAALGAAHARGLVHRDVKPSNIMIDPHTGRAIVLDFGISASAQEIPREDRLTATGVYIGTPRYMAPEQASGEGATDRSDVYSLGCVAYELLAGRPVFEGKSALALMAAHMRDTPTPLTEIRPGIDRELAALVTRCLEKEPGKRPDADEIVQRLAPGGGVLLEWPPPGLERLQGASRGVSRSLWLGNALVLLAVLPQLLFGSRLPSVGESTGVLLLIVAGAVGIGVVAVGAVRAARIGRAARRAVGHGYGWFTVLEVIGDVDAESGLMITGSRRFAAVPAAQRSELRRGRVERALALFAGGVLTMPTLYAVLLLGESAPFGARLSLLVLLIPAAAALLAERAMARERRVAPPLTLKGVEFVPLETARLAPAWYETFERARNGQRHGAGTRRRPAAGIIGAVVIAGIVVLMVGTLVPLMLVSTIGGIVTDGALPRFASTLEKMQIAEVTRSHVLPRNPSTTAVEAGRAFYAMQGPLAYQGRARLQPQPPRLPHPWDSLTTAKALFPTAVTDYWSGPSAEIIELSFRGTTVAQRDYLRAVAAAEQWRDWDLVARSPRMDVTGTMLETPFVAGLSIAEIPIPRVLTLKRLAYASAVRAAWFISQRQLDSAEAALRSVVSVGFAMADNGTSVIEQLVGVVIVGIGRDQLIRFYGATGNPAGARLKARTDSAVSARDQRVESEDLLEASVPQPPPTRALTRQRAMSLATRRNLHRALRGEFLAVLALAPCTNARELAFGMDPDVAQAFALARAEMVRFPTDLALLNLMEHDASVQYDPGRLTLPKRALLVSSHLAGAVLRNPRIPGCTGRMLGAEMF